MAMRGVRRRVLRSSDWLPANSPQSLHEQVHDNLCRLGSTCSTWSTSGLPPDRRPLGGSGHAHAQFEALAELQQQGLIRHLALSTVSLGRR
jgi:pyridoxine 4-dehydrogenase